ncbi:MAG: DUF5050 domain-containing protein [Lachnospiraceae bacterium]|nr:DUF5050 domain-containing protein [Lachnospiraceae bacterium]
MDDRTVKDSKNIVKVNSKDNIRNSRTTVSKKETGKKSSLKPVLIISVIILLVAGLLIYNYISGKVQKSAPGTIGNTAGNLYNGGLFCENGGKIYFSNPNDDYTLYSMDSSISNFKKLYNDYVRYINVDENYVYYTRQNNKKENPTKSIFIFFSTGVYRIKKNGSALAKISSEPCGSLVLYDNELYYQVYKNSALSLYKADIAGENEKKLFSDDTPVVSVYNGNLYYSGNLNESNIHSLKQSGVSSVAVETKSYMPIATEEGIFYVSVADNYNIFLTDYEDKERKCIVAKPVTWYNITSDGRYIFYNCDEGDNSAVYMFDREKNETEKIRDGNYKWLNVAGGYCFFFDYFTEQVYAYDYTERQLSVFNPPSK